MNAPTPETLRDRVAAAIRSTHAGYDPTMWDMRLREADAALAAIPKLSPGVRAHLLRLLDQDEADAALHAHIIDREDDAKRRSAFYREGNAQAARAELQALP